MKELKKKSLTAKDREQFIHRYRESQGRIAWTNHKVRFGQQDIFGCIDTISYAPERIILDQTSTINHMSHKRAEIVRMLKSPPNTDHIKIVVHGVDGYRLGDDRIITRHVMETWLIGGTWNREQIYPLESIRSPTRRSNDQEGAITKSIKKGLESL